MCVCVCVCVNASTPRIDQLSSVSVIQLLQLLTAVLSRIPSSVVVEEEELEDEEEIEVKCSKRCVDVVSLWCCPVQQDGELDPLASPSSLTSCILRLVLDGPLTATLVSQP